MYILHEIFFLNSSFNWFFINHLGSLFLDVNMIKSDTLRLTFCIFKGIERVKIMQSGLKNKSFFGLWWCSNELDYRNVKYFNEYSNEV